MPMRHMVVDDEIPVLQVLRDLLEPLGNEVTAFSNSAEAAERLEAQRFDCILLDMNMPAPDGYELTRRARASGVNNRTPIVMITGMTDVETMKRAFSAGATGFLGKPISRDRIQNLLAAIGGPISRERRRSARLAFRTKVECVRGGPRAERFVAESLNMGEGGMLLEGAGGAEIGERLSLEFRLPSADRPLRTSARVLRKEPEDRMAVEFLDLAIRDLEAIQEYIVSKPQG